MLRRFNIFFIFSVCFVSCDKEINLSLDKNTSMLVIEANITDQPGPYFVKVTRSVAVTDKNVFPGVTNATITISDNLGKRDTLIHTIDGVYQTNKLRGAPGITYYLEVQVDGKKITAESTMPQKVALDSLRINGFEINGVERYNIIPGYTDPIQLGNSYRFIQKINDTLDQTFHVFNDNLNNGKVNQRPLRIGTDQLEIKLKDTISVEMQCVTRDTYLYYYTLNQQSSAGPGGGTTPSNPPSNIQGGALGIFSAHTKQVKIVRVN
jgi:hypothetical protein